jgi:uncharacterized OB-fold protein
MLDSSIKVWRNQKSNKKYLGKTGKIVAWTKVYTAPKDFKADAPYFSALVFIEETKEKIFAQISDVQNIKVGDKVIGVLRRLHSVNNEQIIPYGVKFVIV